MSYQKSALLLKVEQMVKDYDIKEVVDKLDQQYKHGVLQSFKDVKRVRINKIYAASRKLYKYTIWWPYNLAKVPQQGIVFSPDQVILQTNQE